MTYDSYNDLITIDELCDILSIGKNTAYRLLNDKKIVSGKVILQPQGKEFFT